MGSFGGDMPYDYEEQEEKRLMVAELEQLRARVAHLESKTPCCSTARQLIQAAQAPTTCGACAHLYPADHDGPDYCTHPDRGKGFDAFVNIRAGLPPGCPRRTWTVVSHKVKP